MRDKISRYRSEEETDKLLEEQFIREAEEMEARILRAAGADPMEEPPEESQEEISAGYDRVIATLKASGEYREETEDRKLLGFQEFQEWTKEIAREQKLFERAGIAAVSLLIVFMAGMTITADNTSALEASRAMFHIEKHVESDDHLSEETKEEAKEKSIEEPEELTEESAGK